MICSRAFRFPAALCVVVTVVLSALGATQGDGEDLRAAEYQWRSHSFLVDAPAAENAVVSMSWARSRPRQGFEGASSQALILRRVRVEDDR